LEAAGQGADRIVLFCDFQNNPNIRKASLRPTQQKA